MTMEQKAEVQNRSCKDKELTSKDNTRAEINNAKSQLAKKQSDGNVGVDCLTKEVKEALSRWGIEELLVKRLGGKSFLLRINDVKLLKSLEKQHWSESFTIRDRTMWIEVRGVPVH
ncbi:hypothetical protein V6N13_057079 [Hibiscus sabdariffa]|uniref:DUF4283 domain-containing protein n=1 Tax=Hibiscus sabdariffa TaxID=183260 RepID=A0ABR2NMU8_9ROSI